MRPQSRTLGGHWKLKKARKWVSPEPSEGMSPANILILARDADFGLLTSRIIKAYVCVALGH